MRLIVTYLFFKLPHSWISLSKISRSLICSSSFIFRSLCFFSSFPLFHIYSHCTIHNCFYFICLLISLSTCLHFFVIGIWFSCKYGPTFGRTGRLENSRWLRATTGKSVHLPVLQEIYEILFYFFPLFLSLSLSLTAFFSRLHNFTLTLLHTKILLLSLTLTLHRQLSSLWNPWIFACWGTY